MNKPKFASAPLVPTDFRIDRRTSSFVNRKLALMCVVVASFFAVATVEGQDRGGPSPPGVIVVPWRAERVPVGYTGFVTAYAPGFAYGIIPGATYCSYAYGCYTEGGTYTGITPSSIDVDGFAMFRYAGTSYIAIYIDGQFQMVVDTAYPPSVQQFVSWMSNDVAFSFPKFFEKFKIAQDMWWALKTGASDECNKATAAAGAAAMLAAAAALKGDGVAYAASLIVWAQAYDEELKKCPW